MQLLMYQLLGTGLNGGWGGGGGTHQRMVYWGDNPTVSSTLSKCATHWTRYYLCDHWGNVRIKESLTTAEHNQKHWFWKGSKLIYIKDIK